MRRLSVLAACFAAVTCSDPTGPDGALGLSIALQQIAGVEDYLAAGTGKGGAVESLAPGTIPSGCDYNFASGVYTCPASTTSALGISMTVNRSYELLDAAGDHRALFDAKTVTRIRITTSATGSYQIMLPPTSSTFTTTIDDTLSLSGTRELNGSSVTSATAVINGKTKTTQLTQVIAGVVPTVNATQAMVSGGLPLAGSITSVASGTDTAGTALPSTTITTTFNGTPTYTTVVQKTGSTTTYKCTYSKGTFNQVFVSCSIAP